MFEVATAFALCEGVLPAPESAHALAAAAQELADEPAEKTVLINISGMGHHDLAGYAEYAAGTLDDGILPEEQIARSLTALHREQSQY